MKPFSTPDNSLWEQAMHKNDATPWQSYRIKIVRDLFEDGKVACSARLVQIALHGQHDDLLECFTALMEKREVNWILGNAKPCSDTAFFLEFDHRARDDAIARDRIGVTGKRKSKPVKRVLKRNAALLVLLAMGFLVARYLLGGESMAMLAFYTPPVALLLVAMYWACFKSKSVVCGLTGMWVTVMVLITIGYVGMSMMDLTMEGIADRYKSIVNPVREADYRRLSTGVEEDLAKFKARLREETERNNSRLREETERNNSRLREETERNNSLIRAQLREEFEKSRDAEKTARSYHKECVSLHHATNAMQATIITSLSGNVTRIRSELAHDVSTMRAEVADTISKTEEKTAAMERRTDNAVKAYEWGAEAKLDSVIAGLSEKGSAQINKVVREGEKRLSDKLDSLSVVVHDLRNRTLLYTTVALRLENALAALLRKGVELKAMLKTAKATAKNIRDVQKKVEPFFMDFKHVLMWFGGNTGLIIMSLMIVLVPLTAGLLIYQIVLVRYMPERYGDKLDLLTASHANMLTRIQALEAARHAPAAAAKNTDWGFYQHVAGVALIVVGLACVVLYCLLSYLGGFDFLDAAQTTLNVTVRAAQTVASVANITNGRVSDVRRLHRKFFKI